MPAIASITSALCTESLLTNLALYELGRRQTTLYSMGRSHYGSSPQMTIHWSHRGKTLGENVLYTATQIAIPDFNRRRPIAASIFRCVGSPGAGSFEKDVYFSAVPSQKSTLSLLATITEQLLWLGGPAPACLTLLLSASLRKPPLLPKIHTRLPKDGRQTQKQMWLNLFASGKLRKWWSFYQRWWQRRRWWRCRGLDFYIYMWQDAWEPIYLQNNRQVETYMTLPHKNLTAVIDPLQCAYVTSLQPLPTSLCNFEHMTGGYKVFNLIHVLIFFP